MEFIGIDVGSQGTKITLLSENGIVKANEYFTYPTISQRPLWAEQDPKEWKNAILTGLKNIVSKSENPKELKVIGIDAQVDGVILIDKDGNELSNAIIWMDRRATDEEKFVTELFGEKYIFDITGCNIDSSHSLPKILWLLKNLSTNKKVYKILSPTSYILLYLTGKFGIDHSNASSTLFFDIRKKIWNKDILSAVGIDPSLLPEVYPCTYSIGKLKKEIAEYAGFYESPNVAVGCGDEFAACIGAGAIEEDVLFDITGTAEGIGITSKKLIFDNSHLVETHGHAFEDCWFLENPGFVSGGNLKWFRDNFCTVKDFTYSYHELDLEASKIPPGSNGTIFLPTLNGAVVPEWNSYAKGNLYGFSLNCTRGQVVKAILEATAYGVRDVLEALRKMGFSISKVRVAGGGSKSKLWNQIKADVLNLPLETLCTPETTSFGSCLIGAVSIGFFQSLKEAIKKTVRVSEMIQPKEHIDLYEKAYLLYRDIYFSLKPVFYK